MSAMGPWTGASLAVPPEESGFPTKGTWAKISRTS